MVYTAETPVEHGRLPPMSSPEDIADALNLPAIEVQTAAQLPTAHGVFTARVYVEAESGEQHLTLWLGDDAGDEPPPLVRLHSECLTGDVFGSLRCDCGQQLDAALARIAAEGRGALLYLRQEGRGIGLYNKIRAYALQDRGLDTVEANEHLGFPDDLRDYSFAAAMLHDLGVRRLRLLTNNPRKLQSLTRHGLQVVERLPLHVGSTDENAGYLATKRTKLGHLL